MNLFIRLSPCWASVSLRHRLWDSMSGAQLIRAKVRWGPSLVQQCSGKMCYGSWRFTQVLWEAQICHLVPAGASDCSCLWEDSLVPGVDSPRGSLSLSMVPSHLPLPFCWAGRVQVRWRIRHLHCFPMSKFNSGQSMQLMCKVNLSTGLELHLSLMRLLQPFSSSPQMLLPFLCPFSFSWL